MSIKKVGGTGSPQRVVQPVTSIRHQIKNVQLSALGPGIIARDPGLAPPIVRAIEVRFSKSEIRLIPEDQVSAKLNSDYFMFLKDGELSVVSKALFPQNKTEIFSFAAAHAIESMESRMASEKHRDIFDKAAELAFEKKGTVEHFRHFTFMLNEAVKEGGDYLLGAAIMLHNLDDKSVNKLAVSMQKKYRSALNEVLAIRQRYLRLENTLYLPPPGKHNFFIQNFMDALISMAEGDGRAVLLRLLHRYSSLLVKSDKEPRKIKSTKEIYAPLAERLGLHNLAVGLLDTAFRLQNAQEHKKTEEDILWTVKFGTRQEAEQYLETVGRRLQEELAKADHKEVRVDWRLKNPWSAFQKTELKSEEYPEVIYMLDLFGVRAVTKERIKTQEEAVELVRRAAGEELLDFNYAMQQTEEKKILVSGQEVRYFHVCAKMKKHRSIEFQLISGEDYKAYANGVIAHWAYKLTGLTGQKFDTNDLKAYGEKMTGNYLNDTKTIYDHLKDRWLYVFAPEICKKTGGKCTRVIRRKKGSISLDAASAVLNGNIRNYGGIATRKIWETGRQTQKVADTRPLENGDLVEVLLDGASPELDDSFISLIPKTGHIRTRYDILTALKGNRGDLNVNVMAQAGEKMLKDALGGRYNRELWLDFSRRNNIDPRVFLALLAVKSPKIVDIQALKQEILALY